MCINSDTLYNIYEFFKPLSLFLVKLVFNMIFMMYLFMRYLVWINIFLYFEIAPLQ